ncbi:hypothetical protein [Moraxella lacunata]|uniref:hypothetical protein n=1 Tax=Moraxella lacunata TaxID=477 RepID=UPI003EE028F6
MTPFFNNFINGWLYFACIILKSKSHIKYKDNQNKISTFQCNNILPSGFKFSVRKLTDNVFVIFLHNVNCICGILVVGMRNAYIIRNTPKCTNNSKGKKRK